MPIPTAASMLGVVFQHPHYAQHLFLKKLSSLTHYPLGRAGNAHL